MKSISAGATDRSRGALPHVARRFRANCVWMNAKALEPGRSYFVKHTSHQVRGVVRAINYRLDVNTLERSAQRGSN